MSETILTPFPDVRVFANTPVSERPLNSWETRSALPGQEVPTNTPRVPVTASVAGSGLIEQGVQAMQEANREKATVLESVGAAMHDWTPMEAYRAITVPTFPAQEGFNPQGRLGELPFVVDAEKRKWLLESNSDAAFNFKAGLLEDHERAERAKADHSVISGVVSMADPGYWALASASAGAGALLRGSRVAGAAVGAAGGYGASLVAEQTRPVSTEEKVMGVLMNAAVGFHVVREGKIVKSDPAYPQEELQAVTEHGRGTVIEARTEAAIRSEEKSLVKSVKAEERPVKVEAEGPRPVEGGDVPVTTLTAPEGRAVGEPAFKYKPYSARGLLLDMENHADPLVSTLATRLAEMLGHDIQVRATSKSNLPGKRPYYDPAHHAVYLAQDTPQHLQLHEITHAMTSHKLEFGLKNPETAHGQIATQIEQLWQDTKAAYTGNDKQTQYFLKDIHEFVAGAFSGKSAFTDLLANTPVRAGGASVLSKFVDSVRKLLGMKKTETNALTQTLGLTEKLVGEKLNVSLLAEAGEGSLSIRMAPPSQGISLAGAAAYVKKATKSQGLAKMLEVSLHGELSAMGDTAKRVADLLVDSPLDMTQNSVVSQHRAIRADLSAHEFVYTDLLQDTMASKGFGLWQQINPATARKAIAAQQQIEREVKLELLRRNRLHMDGKPIDHVGVEPTIKKLADAVDATHAAALQELKAAGVTGADTIAEAPGYFSRKYDIAKFSEVERAFMESGLSQAEARTRIVDSFSIAMQRANGWDASLAQDVSRAVVDRVFRKGYFEDSLFTQAGKDSLVQLDQMLTHAGVSGANKQRVLGELMGKVDEAGKAPMLKRRVDMAMDEKIPLPDGREFSIADMIDSNLTSNMRQYLDSTAAQSALARKGLTTASDVVNLRQELLHSIEDMPTRKRAAYLFDQTMNALRGLPTGEELPALMRKSQALTQMVGLAWSGAWQITEFAKPMAEYGMLRTLGAMFKELPVARTLFDSPTEAGHLRNVLTRNASQDMRLMPFINKMEDNFDIPVSDIMQLSMNQAKQLVPYANGMKFIQKYQSRVVANLAVNTLERAAAGETKALEALAKYGLESHSMGNIRAEIAKHGMDTAKWSDAAWAEARGPLTKMMDDSVLKHRTGEIPAFAQFSVLGKFIFTFRGFVLGAHNKVLAGELHRNGFGGLGLLMLYQFPLTAAVTAANNTIAGKKPMDDKTLAATAVSQMSAVGLLGEVAGAAFGTKQQFGTPGLIVADRAVKLVSDVGHGKWNNAAADAYGLTPIVSTFTPAKAIGEALKGH